MCTDRDKWVPMTSVCRDLRLRVEKELSLCRVAANILNEQSRTAEKVWPSSGLGAD